MCDITYHSLNRPFGICRLWFDGYAVVNGDLGSRIRAATNHHFQRCSVGSFLGHENRSPFERITSSSGRVVDAGWNVGHCLHSVESNWVQDSGLVVVGNKDAATWKNSKKWVQIVGISALQPVAELHISASRLRKNLKSWHGSTIGADLTSDDQDRSVGQNQTFECQCNFGAARGNLPVGYHRPCWRLMVWTSSCQLFTPGVPGEPSGV